MQRHILERWIILTALVGITLISPLAAHAGGWSVVTLDQTPGNIQAGQPFTIGFRVLQHGIRPVGGLEPIITLRQQAAASSGSHQAALVASPEIVTVVARAEGAVGHYIAEITLPTAGTWGWQIEAFGPPAELSPISVAAPAITQAQEATVLRPAPTWAWGAVLVIAVGALGSLWYVGRERRRVDVRA